MQLKLSAAIVSIMLPIASGPALAQEQSDVEPLSGEELRETFVDNTLYTSGHAQGEDWEWAGYYASDGTAVGRAWWPKGGKSGAGRWRIEDDLWCVTWEPEGWGGGEENCQEVYRDGERLRFVVVKGPAEDGEGTIISGNPYGL